MPVFIVEIWLDGYDTHEEMVEACEEFIREQLDSTGSSVEIQKMTPTQLYALATAPE